MFKLLIVTYFLVNTVICGPEEEEGVKYADKCEGEQRAMKTFDSENTWILLNYRTSLKIFFSVCKVVATELEARLDETGKSSDFLEIGYSLDDVAPKKRKEYKKSWVLKEWHFCLL